MAKKTIKKKTRGKPRSIGPILEPSPDVDKSGCYHCPLLPFSKDFSAHADQYQKDADGILGKQKTEHVVHTRCVEEDWTEVDVLLVGEAPGREEDYKGKPFVGKAGEFVRDVWEEISDIPFDRVGFANPVRCRPPRNKTPSKTEVKCCSHRLFQEIHARKPKVIVVLGNAPMDLLANETGVTTLQGSRLRNLHPELPDGTVVIACAHPAYVLRLRTDDAIERFASAMALAHKYATGQVEEELCEGEYITVEDVDDAVELIDTMIENKARVRADIESGSLQPRDDRYPTLLCLSLTDEAGIGVTIPLDHYDSPWADPEQIARQYRTEVDILSARIEEAERGIEQAKGKATKAKREALRDQLQRERDEWDATLEAVTERWEQGGREEREKIDEAIIRLLTDAGITTVWQNGKFDAKHLYHCYGVWIANFRTDTMHKHAAMDSRRGTHGLKTLAYGFGDGMGGYEHELLQYIDDNKRADPKEGGSYANIPGDLLFRYAAMDADVTARVDDALSDHPDYRNNEKLHNMVEVFLPQLALALARMEYHGAQVDQSVVKSLKQKHEGILEGVQEKIRKLPEIPQYEADQMAKGKHGKRKPDDFVFNPGSDPQVRQLLFDYYGLEPLPELTETGHDVIKHRAQQRREQDDPSWEDLIREAIERKEWEIFTVKAEVLNEYKNSGNEFASMILDYREHSKLLSTFILPLETLVDSEGRIHGSFHETGTETGRLSSSNPNLQNIPYAARSAYTSRFDRGFILQLDQSQVELRVGCSLYYEPTMVEAYRNGVDNHRLAAIDIVGKGEEGFRALPADEQKEWRAIGKRTNFLSVYQGQSTQLQRTLKGMGIHRTHEECEAIIDKFHESRSSLFEHMMEFIDAAAENGGNVETVTGRIRQLPDLTSDVPAIYNRARRQAGNVPVQSAAGDITLISLVLVDNFLQANGYRSMLVGSVHDSLVIDAHPDEWLEIAVHVQWIMESVPDLSDHVWPGLAWDWLKCPLVAEAELGRAWNPAVEFDPVKLKKGRKTVKPLWADREKGKRREPVNADELVEVIDAA